MQKQRKTVFDVPWRDCTNFCWGARDGGSSAWCHCNEQHRYLVSFLSRASFFFCYMTYTSTFTGLLRLDKTHCKYDCVFTFFYGQITYTCLNKNIILIQTFWKRSVQVDYFKVNEISPWSKMYSCFCFWLLAFTKWTLLPQITVNSRQSINNYLKALGNEKKKKDTGECSTGNISGQGSCFYRF